MDLELGGQRAVVAGGANGIGLAIAEAFAEEDADVMLLDIDVEAAHREAARIGKRWSVASQAARVDVSDDASVDEAIASLNRMDHLIFAAGAGSGKFGFPFWNLDAKDWPRVWDVNLQGAVRFLHGVAPKLTQQRSGTILLLASIAGQIGSQTDPPYSAAKAALLNFAQCAAKDLAPFNVRVNSICPGMVKTKLNQSVWQAWQTQDSARASVSYDQWAAEKLAQVAPLNRWQEPEDIAAMAVFLASNKAQNITGQTINVDGGQVMHS